MREFTPNDAGLSAEATAFLAADAPEQKKMAAARGMVPMLPAELATIQFGLVSDSSPAVAAAARESLTGMPPNLLEPLLGEQLHPAVLHFLVTERGDLNDQQLSKVLLNKATADETVEGVAQTCTSNAVLEVIANNQVRISRYPAIADALFNNEALGTVIKNRLLEFYQSTFFKTGEEKKAAAAAAAEEAAPQEVAEIKPPEGLDAAAFEEKDEEDEEPQEEEHLGWYAKIQKMNVAEQVKTALMGNKECRNILVKSPNKLVCSAVVRNPRITESEVATIATNKSVSDEVLRIISMNKEWMANYSIKLALTQNPKTPTGISLRLLNFLTEKDVTGISKSKSVAGPIAAAARRMSLAKRAKKK